MLKISSPFTYNIGLMHTYLERYRRDSDSEALHQYVLCLLHHDNFVAEDGCVNEEILDRLNQSLKQAIITVDAQPYEVLYYVELNRALKVETDVEKIWETRPEFREFCKLGVGSYDFLMHVGLYEAALTCCQDLFNVTLISYTDFLNRYGLTLLKMKRQEEAYEFMLNALRDRDFFLPPFIVTRLTKLAIEINKTRELLEEYRNRVATHENVKWISLDYIRLCLEQNLEEEAWREYERIEAVIRNTFPNNEVTSEGYSLFRYLCSIRNLLGMSHDRELVGRELGLVLKYIGEVEKPKVASGRRGTAPWENDFNRMGSKALLKREAKMNKPFRTFFKLFSGGEKDMIYAKSIFANYASLVANRFSKLFHGSIFEVTDYDVFYEAFPFYALNGFSEEEIDEFSVLLTRIHRISVQLNPSMSSRSFPINELLEDLLSVNKELVLENKTYKYEVGDQSSSQLTMFGVVLFLCTFLTTEEKEKFAVDLAGADSRLTVAMQKQIMDTIPAAVGEAEGMETERNVFSIYIRREMFRFLLELECQIIKEFDLLKPDKPNVNCMTLSKVLELKYSADSKIYEDVLELYTWARRGMLLGEVVGDKIFSIENVVRLMAECHMEDNRNDLFKAGLESLFSICVNRKYYNQMKWMKSVKAEAYPVARGNYCKELFYRNQYLMTAEDEQALYECTSEHIFTYVDDAQNREFTSVFGEAACIWKKLTVEIYRADTERCTCQIDGVDVPDEYFVLGAKEALSLKELPGYKFKGWSTEVVFDSPIAEFVLMEAIF